jgi:hypothetical protein
MLYLIKNNQKMLRTLETIPENSFAQSQALFSFNDSVLLMVDAKSYMIDIFVECTCFCDVTLV